MNGRDGPLDHLFLSYDITTISSLYSSSKIERRCHETFRICIDGWMDDCDFMSFSTVFQTYQDDWSLIMKGCV